ncbi:MAG: urea ABC transporter substrate-binding protein [Nitrospirota bacterium]|nr:urea ABC transporter substrate-binding protein [Nitrospirota bacterium]
MKRLPFTSSNICELYTSRRQFLARAGVAIGSFAMGFPGLQSQLVHGQPLKGALKVGVLHSLTGTMASSGRSLVDAILMAIDEVNQQGGVLGRPLQPIIHDGASNPRLFAEKAQHLINVDQVHTIFGCWTSASRKAVLPVVERAHHLLWYPVQYEGYEQSSAIMYGGAAPNQQIIPGLEWGLNKFGKKVFLVGSDYVFPRTANRLIKAELQKRDAVLSGEYYQPLGGQDFQGLFPSIIKSKPDFLINTINGDSNKGFFQGLYQANLSADRLPVISMSVAEDELQSIGIEYTKGHYAAWNYFQSIDTPANQRFVSSFQQRYGQDRVTGDPIESAYVQVHLYKMAVTKAGSTDPDKVREATKGLIFDAPQGLIRVDPDTCHTWKVARIGKIQSDGQFSIVWSSHLPLQPNPFPLQL